ncbi:surface lipoprotein assembly modifier [Pseudomonas auratipiscis]|uniref:Surface lipoprotein assembly modifier n=1 Tax=Pseudomonas auratipiscis TaxID=3115853 RepID=A0AB35WS60_9PSED|nr:MULTISPECIES: surface lipoprotein assembly modifier [unclassified Pseudomonas]MEE1867550.1 surface lipoprotein assembly modifier [Pseudomonas sp. 120P]MEE1958377.1 surface lipoprotein assembly modifier [Pseudomonas sp. 119P]
MPQPYCMRSLTPHLISFFLLMFTTAGFAADQDTSLRLNQSIEYRANQQEREFLKDELPNDTAAPLLNINGQNYSVGNNLDELGRAVYLSIERQQWLHAKDYLKRYTTLPGHDPMLTAYANGALARADGDLEKAEHYYRQLLGMQADFLPGRLELARVLFENRKDRDSSAVFEQISSSLSPADAQAMGLGKTVDSFLQALDHREDWQGSLAIGPIWSDNLNQSSESTVTYRMDTAEGTYLIKRSLPKAVSAQGADYEATLNKRVAIRGHHGLFVRSLLYGQAYDKESKYNEGTLINNAGYSYHDARNQYSLGPSFEFNTIGDNAMYSAWGLRGEWMHTLSPTRMFKLEGEYKDMVYKHDINTNLDGDISSVYATLWQALPRQWTLFGGLDISDRNSQDRTAAYLQKGLRLGVAKDFGVGVNAVLFASYRKRQYDAYSAILDARRNDDEQSYTFILRAPRLAVHDIVPSLTVKYNKVDSNIDWLYAYDKNSISFKLEKQF